ncbi:MAG: RsmB/NOP family class I SAM-dependent RNA methyltransferase [Opitutales bacterium]
MKRDVKPGFLNPPNRPLKPAADGWATAVLLTERWLARHDRVDTLLEGLTPGLPAQERARAQHLFYGVVRWSSRLELALTGLMSRPPRTKVRAVLLLAGFEILEGGTPAQVIHHAVEQAKTVASPKEAGLINAVARKMAGRLAEDMAQGPEEGAQGTKIRGKKTEELPSPGSVTASGVQGTEAGSQRAGDKRRKTDDSGQSTDDGAVAALARRWAHPEWLVARWVKQFGLEATRQLLAWNQQPAPVYARWRPASVAPAEGGPAAETIPPFLTPTRWPGFFEVKAGHWDEVRQLAQAGSLYLQDPSTRLCVELLAPQPGETILDACAAPGGKSLMIADAMKSGRIVALDEPGPRLVRLQENLNRAPAGVTISLMPGDLKLAGAQYFAEYKLPDTYDAVLLDAPCSNTGVMRHRIDVKWRLQEGDFNQHAQQQLALLHAAARLVRPGGRLVYSTCSLEAMENENVLQAFFDSRAGGPFKLERQILAYPWVEGHDGAGAFLLRKS